MTTAIEQPPIEHAVPLPNGSIANTVAPVSVIEAMYPVGMTDPVDVYIDATRTDELTGIRTTAFNTTLRFVDLPGGRRAVSGNTVTRLCPRVCAGACALGGQGLTIERMSDQNCARANTSHGFEAVGVAPEGRFMILPVAKKGEDNKPFNDYFVVDDSRLTPEYNGDELMQNKIDASYAPVFTKSYLEEKGIKKLGFGMQGADGSFGVTFVEFKIPGDIQMVIDDETLIIPFGSLRQNMGDREEKDQILRSALNAYFDSKQYDPAIRELLISSAHVSVVFAASASLPNFAHKIKLPEEGSAKAIGIRERQADLVARAGGRLTSAIVLNDEWAGAMERGNVWPELEAKADRRLPNPVSPENCPLDGQTCNVDYREETRYAIMKQLTGMGISEDNIRYDTEGVRDPADPDNKMASNRAEQNEGVEVVKTNRTLNALVIELP